MKQSPMLDRALSLTRFDPSPRHRGPQPARLATATVASVGLCLLADALLVVITVAIFPSTKGYVHFQFSDYSKLTVIGVLIACAAWPAVVRLTSDPRWLFFRLAIAVTVVLLLPDLAIWLRGQPGRAVLGLAAMHLAIALITYNVLVRAAPPRQTAAARAL